MAKHDAMVNFQKNIGLSNEEKVIQAVNLLVKRNEEITCKKLADIAGINRTSIYRYKRVRKILEEYNVRPQVFRSGDSTAVLLKLEESKTKRLERKCKKLENLAEDAAKYKEQCQNLKQENKELKELLAEKDGGDW